MSALATLRDISFVTVDGRTLFKKLNLTFDHERVGLVGRNGVGKTTLLRLIGGDLSPSIGAVSITGRIGYLRQNPDCGNGRTVADDMDVADAIARLGRITAGCGSAEDFDKADWGLEQRVEAALNEAGLAGIALGRRLATLSGGQRTRVALAGLLLSRPDLLLLDEPTNNLDSSGREALLSFLEDWRGGAVIVSHDRNLLRRVDRIVELSDLGIASYGGNWDFYKERKAEEVAAAALGLAQAKRALRDTERRIQAASERQERRNAAGKRSRAEGGVPKILLDARKDQASRTEGRGGQLAEKMRGAAQERLETAENRVERTRPRNFVIASPEQPGTRRIVTLSHISGGPRGAETVIRDISFSILGGERLALSGPNGAGKTTLLKMIADSLPITHGEIHRYGIVTMLDQEVGLLSPGETVFANFRRLNPEDNDNACRAALARFLFRAEAALQTVGTLSGGERLRAGLACVLGGAHPPDLLILDEPTNHLDLQSIEAMESALKDYGGALLVVSHDEDFLKAIGVQTRIALGMKNPTYSVGQT